MHTEDEARQMKCPMKLKTSQADTENSQNCEGSTCMAWRWVVSSQDETHYLGFCGLACKPFD
jgi:hypothetical protein